MDQVNNKQLDLGNLTLFDSNPVIEETGTKQNINTAIINKVGSNIYYIFSQMLSQLKLNRQQQEKLPEEMQIRDFSKSVFNLRLPPGNTVFPRSRKIPKKKDKTKWEKFAEEKGIKKQKRSGKLFDEQTQQYMPRWGSKSKNNLVPPILEEKEPGVNPFKERELQKKLRVSKQQLHEQKNRSRPAGERRSR